MVFFWMAIARTRFIKLKSDLNTGEGDVAMANPRLYAFDLEGTLTKHGAKEHAGHHYYPSDWPLLAEALGKDCLDEENALTELWMKQQKTGEQLVGTYVDYMQKRSEIARRC